MPEKQNRTPDSLSLKVIQLLGHHDSRGQHDGTDWARALLLGTDPVFLGALRIIPEPAQTLLGNHRIDEEQLEQRNPVSVADVFRGESSVAVNGGAAIAQKVVVNGIEESLLSVTIDAARQNKSAFHHTGNILFDPALLNSVEVSEGIGPADAGPNALAGGLAYTTKDARDFLEPGERLDGLTSLRRAGLPALAHPIRTGRAV
ncbi:MULTISPECIES: TonB-dependent receptor plug domain-containing protein [Mameliella]|uniref:TonB-dependent receptor plug domain-containing protein n=1 Tax=Mameliella TaxID=1434019 RepID=UPI001838CC64|nr:MULTISPECIES: TonB-dependent receptor plug domain-containing protein [Mameliella]MCR9273305.1 Plug domain-containing protein [Paracoccaceae bacterium]